MKKVVIIVYLTSALFCIGNDLSNNLELLTQSLNSLSGLLRGSVKAPTRPPTDQSFGKTLPKASPVKAPQDSPEVTLFLRLSDEAQKELWTQYLIHSTRFNEGRLGFDVISQKINCNFLSDIKLTTLSLSLEKFSQNIESINQQRKVMEDSYFAEKRHHSLDTNFSLCFVDYGIRQTKTNFIANILPIYSGRGAGGNPISFAEGKIKAAAHNADDIDTTLWYNNVILGTINYLPTQVTQEDLNILKGSVQEKLIILSEAGRKIEFTIIARDKSGKELKWQYDAKAMQFLPVK